METRQASHIFISHNSKDKCFVGKLAFDLRMVTQVWYDDWEIGVGDSIVEKVFSGLQESDTLIVILSRSSVESRWVKEEMSVAIMRRIEENNITILPVLIETCEIPTALKHIRYADFRKNHDEGMCSLLDAINPGHFLLKSLLQHYEHFRLVIDQLSHKPVTDIRAADLTTIHDILDASLSLRTEIEFRRARRRLENLSLFDKIEFLAGKGVDVRSPAWNVVVNVVVSVRSHLAHDVCMTENQLSSLLALQRWSVEKGCERGEWGGEFVKILNQLTEVMRIICCPQEVSWPTPSRG